MNKLSQAHLWDKMNLALKQIKENEAKTVFVPKYIIRKSEVVPFNKPMLKAG